MKFLIQPDFVKQKNGDRQSFSKIWFELAQEYGCEAVKANVYESSFFEEVSKANAFMWRFGYRSQQIKFAKIIIPSVEKGLKKAVFPNTDTIWHFEDKVAQKFFLDGLNFPMPKTNVFWDRVSAESFLQETEFPLVVKLSHGIQSGAVMKLNNVDDALELLNKLFGSGITSLKSGRKITSKSLARKGLHHGYIYLQEFLLNNEFDTRVTVIGDRVFAFRRFNRPGDFRASGSGLIDWDPSNIDFRFIEMAFDIAKKSNAQSLAIDGMYREGQPVIGEISYTYASWAIRDCPGHWCFQHNGEWVWIEGSMEPAKAIFIDFYNSLIN